jgi:hypothetical protein
MQLGSISACSEKDQEGRSEINIQHSCILTGFAGGKNHEFARLTDGVAVSRQNIPPYHERDALACARGAYEPAIHSFIMGVPFYE